MEKYMQEIIIAKQSLASPGDRLAAFLFDIVSLFLLGLVAVFAIAPFFGEEAGIIAAKIIIGVSFIPLIALQIYLFVRRSQTIGKFLLNIQIIDAKANKRIGFWSNGIKRELIGKTLIVGALPFLNITFQPLYFIIDHLFIFRQDCRTLHDMIAGTFVIKLSDAQRRKSLVDWKRLPK